MAASPAIDQELLFPKLTEEQIRRLSAEGTRRTFAKGDLIFEQGSRTGTFLVVLSGRVEIVSPAKTGETRITILERGQFSGEVNMLTGRPTLVRARALAPTELLDISLTALRHFVQTDPELS